MNKKVLFIGMTKNRGGLETFMMNVFNKLRCHDYKFEFIKDFSNEKIAYEDEIKENGGIVRTVPILDKKNRRPFLRYVVRNKMVSDFFKSHHDYVAVHINALEINGISFWIKAARKWNLKVILHLHLDKLNIEYTFDRNLLGRFKLLLTKTLTKINLNKINKDNEIIKLAASENSGNRFFYGNDFDVIDNGIDVEKYKFNNNKRIDVKNELGIPQNCKIIMTVASISHQKNYPKIINIFKEIKHINSRVKLVIVGNGEYFNKISLMVKQYGLINDVYFLGVRDDVDCLLSAADLILMPSLLEAFPFALLESQAAGVPGLVSKNVIPQEENITGELTYLPLENSNKHWAKIASEILDKHIDQEKKINMYECVKNSKYNLSYSIKEIKKIYDL